MRIAPLAAALGLASVLAAAPVAALEGGHGKSAGGEKDWSSHKGDIAFLVGRDVGMKEAEFTGKPILYFYTATW